MRRLITASLIIILLFSSCLSGKKILYFQKGIGDKDTIGVAEKYIPRIQVNDNLSITVNSLNPAATAFFNPYTNITTTTADGLTQSATPGYLVNNEGNIELPLVGSMHVAGLTTFEVGEKIKRLDSTYLKGAMVTVRFLNYRISVLGEVAKPGVYVIPNEQITIPEALGLAGDLTVYGKREDITVVRDIDNKKEFGQVNLTDRSIFSSPYYYLHTNDVIYVKTAKSKVFQTETVYKILPLALGVITSLLIIFSRVK